MYSSQGIFPILEDRLQSGSSLKKLTFRDIKALVQGHAALSGGAGIQSSRACGANLSPAPLEGGEETGQSRSRFRMRGGRGRGGNTQISFRQAVFQIVQDVSVALSATSGKK